MTVGTVLRCLDEIAPTSLAFSFDKVGLQVGSATWPCTKIAVSLDSSLAAVAFAREIGADVLVGHHPLIWEPLQSLDPQNIRTRTALELASSQIAFIGAHTNWDCAPDGLNDELARRLRLSEVKPFGSAASIPLYKVITFVPHDSADALISAMSEAGAGKLGEYERCAFSTAGTGTFRGSVNSNPTVGSPGVTENVPETRVEMRSDALCLERVISAIRLIHPYEEPAFDIVDLAETTSNSAGRLGRLPRPMSLNELIAHANDCLGTHSLAWQGEEKEIEWLAVVGGAADSDWAAARKMGAQAFLTGEVKQNVALEAGETGLSILAAGHYATEQPGCEHLCRRLQEKGFDAHLFVPAPGEAGRPLI